MSGERYMVSIGQSKANLTVLRGMSEKLFDDAVRYGKILESQNLMLSASSASYVRNIERVMVKAVEQLPAPDVALLQQHGMSALVADEGRLLSMLYSDKTIKVNLRTCLRLAATALFPELDTAKKGLRSNRLTFATQFSKEPLYADFSAIHALSPKLYDDIASHLEDQKASLAESSLNITTLHSRFAQLRSGLLFVLDHLNEDATQGLNNFGMQAFGLDGAKLQKVIFAALQNAAKTGELTSGSASAYKHALSWFIKGFGLPVIDAYPIPRSRTVIHLTRLNAEDFYSAEECRELAYHVESLLASKDLSSEHRVSLMLGRILLKTGWNLAPTLGIECDDIIRESSPLNPGGILTVVLSKARAGYRSDAYSFTDVSANRAAVRSAAMDLLDVRNDLTAGLRDSLADGDPFKRFVFLFEQGGTAHRLAPVVTSVISDLIQANGCVRRFDTRKIRKGGYNHLYRDLQKNIQEYESAAKHEFKTFESSYLRVDENQARYTLSKAVDVMGDYFTGKEIAAGIIIATEPMSTMQCTPTGECASTGNDSESLRYGVEHKRLLAERQQGVRYCADFLSCIWCKYFRLVADPEHVWKLLSYRRSARPVLRITDVTAGWCTR